MRRASDALDSNNTAAEGRPQRKRPRFASPLPTPEPSSDAVGPDSPLARRARVVAAATSTDCAPLPAKRVAVAVAVAPAPASPAPAAPAPTPTAVPRTPPPSSPQVLATPRTPLLIVDYEQALAMRSLLPARNPFETPQSATELVTPTPMTRASSGFSFASRLSSAAASSPWSARFKTAARDSSPTPAVTVGRSLLREIVGTKEDEEEDEDDEDEDEDEGQDEDEDEGQDVERASPTVTATATATARRVRARSPLSPTPTVARRR